MARRKNKPSNIRSGVWEGLSPESRAEFYCNTEAYKQALSALEGGLQALGMDLEEGYAKERVRVMFRSIVKEIYKDATEELEAEKMRAREEKQLRLKYENALHLHGIEVPRPFGILDESNLKTEE